MKKKSIRIMNIIKYLILFAFFLIIVYPVYLTVITSMKSTADLFGNPFGLPVVIEWSNYVKAWIAGNIGVYSINSIKITSISVILVTVLSSLAAFSLSRKDFIFNKIFYVLFITGMIIPIQAGIIPLYLQMAKTNLYNSHPGIILVYIAYGLPFSVFLMVNFFKNVPREIEEAAVVDGCNNFQLYSRIIMPLSSSIVSTVIIFRLVWIWNDMFFPLILLSKKSLKTIPVGILGFRGDFQTEYPAMFAGVVIASLPLVIAFLLLQEKFIEGLTAGAVKG